MMACPDCGSNLDAVPVRDPCPTCGSHRRDATVSLGTFARAVGTATTIAVSIDVQVNRDRARRRAEDLALGSTVRTVVFHDPGDGGVVVCEARDAQGNILDAKPGRDAADALLNVADALLPPEPDEGG